MEGRVPPDYLAQLLDGYEGYFRAAAKEGKSEEETAAMLGNPAGICRQILGEDSASPAEETRSDLAPMGRRLAAWLIDYAANILFMVGVLLVAGLLSGGDAAFLVMSLLPYLVMTSLGGWGLLSFLTMWLSHGYTLGKRLMGLRVICADGDRMGFGMSLLREIVIKGFLGMIGLWILPIVSLIWAAVKGPACTVHDKIARTLVIREQR